MHEDNFLSSWLREDGREKEEGKKEEGMGNESKEERSDKRRREGEKFFNQR